jgi:hypothetical protein
VPPARHWAWPAHVVDFGPVQVPTAPGHSRSHRLNDGTNEANSGDIGSSRGEGPYPHERPIPCATGSNAKHAVYLRRAKPSLRVSRSRSAAFCEAWVETTLHPLKATSTTIHVSIGTFFMVIVHPSRSGRSSCTLPASLWRSLELSLQRRSREWGQMLLNPRSTDFRASHHATAVDPDRSGNMSVAGLILAKQD